MNHAAGASSSTSNTTEERLMSLTPHFTPSLSLAVSVGGFLPPLLILDLHPSDPFTFRFRPLA